MAALRGTVRGMRGEASRLGSKASGLTVTAATWGGEARLTLAADGTARLEIGHPTAGGFREAWAGNIDEIAADRP